MYVHIFVLQVCINFHFHIAGERFVPETHETGYKITMRLTINDVDAQDFGSYRCVAKNSLGDTDGAIKLYRKYATKKLTLLYEKQLKCATQQMITKIK